MRIHGIAVAAVFVVEDDIIALAVACDAFAGRDLAILRSPGSPYGCGLDISAAADTTVRPGEGVGIHAVDVARVVDQPVAAFAELVGSPFAIAEAGRVQVQLHGRYLAVRPGSITLEFHDEVPWLRQEEQISYPACVRMHNPGAVCGMGHYVYTRPRSGGGRYRQ